MSCWPAGASRMAEVSCPVPAPPAGLAALWAPAAPAAPGRATAPLATAPMAADGLLAATAPRADEELLAGLPEQPASGIAISVSPAATAGAASIERRMPLGRRPAPGRLRPSGHDSGRSRRAGHGSAGHARGHGRRSAREQLAGGPGRRTARTVLPIVGSRRSVGQHHLQQGRAVLLRGPVAE